MPNVEIVTDIIAGFPGESDDDWNRTMDLIRRNVFQRVHVSQFFPRPGTPAARMKPQILGSVKKERTRQLTVLNESHDSVYSYLIGTTQKVWFVDRAPDGKKLVGHTKTYVQVLLPDTEGLLGNVTTAKIINASRWSVDGEVVDIEGSVYTSSRSEDGMSVGAVRSKSLRKLIYPMKSTENLKNYDKEGLAVFFYRLALFAIIIALLATIMSQSDISMIDIDMLNQVY